MGARLKRKVSIIKEKFEADISELQNQIATLKQKKSKLFNAFQNSLNQGLQARDEELLKFEKATNKAILDLKNWVLRKIRPVHQNFDENNSIGAAAHNLTLFDPTKSIFYEASLTPTNDIQQKFSSSQFASFFRNTQQSSGSQETGHEPHNMGPVEQQSIVVANRETV